MLKSYLTIALRNLSRHKGYTFINVMGLTVGLACFLLIALYVKDELSYDRYNTNADRIYRVTRDWVGKDGGCKPPAGSRGTAVRTAAEK
jgi:putative ABC transport system permease protein